MGSWAGPSFVLAPRVASPFPSVVTGASDGIGKEFASAGFNILLVAQNQDMLSDVADEIGASPSNESDILCISYTLCIRIQPKGLKEGLKARYT